MWITMERKKSIETPLWCREGAWVHLWVQVCWMMKQEYIHAFVHTGVWMSTCMCRALEFKSGLS